MQIDWKFLVFFAISATGLGITYAGYKRGKYEGLPTGGTPSQNQPNTVATAVGNQPLKDVYNDDTVFKNGDTDEKILQAQILLDKAGYKGLNGSKLALDGELGQNTAKALNDLRKDVLNYSPIVPSTPPNLSTFTLNKVKQALAYLSGSPVAQNSQENSTDWSDLTFLSWFNG